MAELFRTDPKEMEKIAEEVKACTKCGLCKGRTNAVPGEGNIDATIMLVGEGPGADEDATGRPFVGKAGQLLDQILDAVGIQREEVYIGNIIKCRPPANRTPQPDEVEACLPFLRRQVALIKPKCIVCMGAVAAKAIIGGDNLSISNIRGEVYQRKGFILLPTYHPAALLRNEHLKWDTWKDFKLLSRLMVNF